MMQTRIVAVVAGPEEGDDAGASRIGDCLDANEPRSGRSRNADAVVGSAGAGGAEEGGVGDEDGRRGARGILAGFCRGSGGEREGNDCC